jgi:3-deoxy-7-phosphoheptulonate synthase
MQQDPKDLGRTALYRPSVNIKEGADIAMSLEDTRVERVTPLITPKKLHEQFPLSAKSKEIVINSRRAVQGVITSPSKDSRLIVAVGPCSIHDDSEAREYAKHVKSWRETYGGNLEIIMRAYMEKPRTTTGWPGLIDDPSLDGENDANTGLKTARKLLSDITNAGVPVTSEVLFSDTPQSLDDCFSFGSIGARNAESSESRKIVSAVSFPMGFKNHTSGDIQVAVEGMVTSAHPHSFRGIDHEGQRAIIHGRGNEDTFLILRGGKSGPNFDERHVAEAGKLLAGAGLTPAIMVDLSHGNSGKDYRKQKLVAQNVARQIESGNPNIVGVMIESNLAPGKQTFVYGETKKSELEYGKSITDSCIGLPDTEEMIASLARAVETRRIKP